MILADVLLQDPENINWYTGHSLKLCCVVIIMQLETDTNILVQSKPMHMPIYILGQVYMEAETCTATHAGISTSHVRRGADSKNYFAVIIAPTFISNHLLLLDSCMLKINPDPLHK